jgi:hypothetical protein
MFTVLTPALRCPTKPVFFIFLLLFLQPTAAQTLSDPTESIHCDYYMCQYEKGNIDAIILEHAKLSQTVMFGEIHDTVLAGAPAPVGDSLYVASLLPELRTMEYNYLALEVDKHELKPGHSFDMVRFHEAYQQGKTVVAEGYIHAKPGWIGLMQRAMDAGYEIRFFDVGAKRKAGSLRRDQAMFNTLKQEIFDHEPDAKVIVYIGANHISERPTDTGIYLYKGKRRPLGYFLDAYTGGRNFSVYMGHPYDTPEGCDLFISDFIWNMVQKRRAVTSVVEPSLYQRGKP